ncbi:NAD-dependent epimerase/dehydratase family protein [Vibrio vulnificus]|uniref:NAD-dependent epimerase/dehydratase family protein n=1 Tax=Vibrio vulnificus TaxID=672 RepID=UPI001CDC3158|nr:NAD(P)-dependent oxidoreductase [Vibrio vulnificus]MCA3963738.1 NAD(P)-dependent oxidoreductase [Vibrio vulnificus]
MKVLITGIAGFVGSTISRMFLEHNNNIDIIGVDNLSFGYEERISDLLDRINFINMDVKSLHELDISNIDVIIHCAAIAPLPECQKNIFKCIEQNVAMCGAISDFATKIGCENVIFFSSGAVYEGSGDRVCSETDDIDTALIYPTSKHLAEKLFSSVARTYGIKVVSIRLFNLYGPQQDYFRKQPPLLGYLLKSVIEGDDITLYASENAKRDYIYIDDLYELINKIIIRMPHIEKGKHIVVNAASGSAYSVYDIVETLERVIGKEINYKCGDKSKFWDKYPELFDKKIPFNKQYIVNEVDKKSIADISFAKEYFNWIPKYTMESGLKECFDFAKTHLTKQS